MNHLYLIRGVPGSGKTTRAKQLVEMGKAICYIEADDYFISPTGEYIFDASKLPEAHALCQRRALALMQCGLNFAVSNTFTRKWEMDVYKKLAKEYRYVVHEEIMRGEYENVHGVPEETVQRMKERFEYD
jgi:predicted ABC-type ATPase